MERLRARIGFDTLGHMQRLARCPLIRDNRTTHRRSSKNKGTFMTIQNRVFSATWTALLSAAVLCAQPPAQPGRGAGRGGPQAPAFVSPEVQADRHVVFRVYAPQAQNVRLSGSDIPGNTDGATLTKGDNGVWEATLGPVDPGAYRYNFNLDGVATIDPRNPSISESNNNVWSMFHIPGADFMDTKDVPHGAVAAVTYYSTVLKKFRRMHVYTPPGYERGQGRFPVFYLLHGAGDCDEAWTSVGRAGFILDNLIAAKKALPHGDFTHMLEVQLPFGERKAQMLMAIARDPRLTKPQNIALLPPSWPTLYELTKLSDEELGAKIADGTISPNMEHRHVVQAAKTARRAEREHDLGAKQQALPQQKFGVVVADPEWRFEPWSRETGMDRAADNHYPTSCTEVIAARDVPSIAAEDCVLFLWATAPMLPQALLVMAAWGFHYKSHCAWIKTKPGTGYWFRNQHELLLLGVKGKIPAPAMGEQWPSVKAAANEEHSAKPELFLEMIEQYFPTLPKIELNRRGPAREGWSCWGLEAEQTTERATAAANSAVASEPAPACPRHPQTGAGSLLSEAVE
jgi:N6-adenosine-specific RNA methylase IME4